MSFIKNIGEHLKSSSIQFSVEKVQFKVVLFELYTMDVASYIQVDIQKKNPTLLYFPSSLD